jgi:ComF family protein
MRDSIVEVAWANFTARLLETLLPACCLLCGQACPQRLICLPCASDLPRIGAACCQCGLPGTWGTARVCADCLCKPPRWDHAIAALVYEYPVDHLVQRFKFHKDLACGRLLAEELARAVKTRLAAATLEHEKQRPDLLIPVPLHFRRRWKRGYNQAELIAIELQRSSGIPMQNNLLKRVRATAAQSGLDRKTRLKNLRDAFRCPSLKGLHVALIDDVLTTGSTLQECSRILKRSGARQVSVWVAARVPAPNA